ncbi:hypothetical protein ACFORG_16210 [Lutimaribacter marinistellae]|uniref:NIL domain-containing protein n=1 Tax=Lutimaribacter marinistellae TaxID=1820329 RepID=A0ABV7TKK2_9RHOB
MPRPAKLAQIKMKEPGTYKIVVSGPISPALRNSLAGMSVSETIDGHGQIQTILVGRLQDQAELAGVMNTLFEMQLPIISTTCLEPG